MQALCTPATQRPAAAAHNYVWMRVFFSSLSPSSSCYMRVSALVVELHAARSNSTRSRTLEHSDFTSCNTHITHRAAVRIATLEILFDVPPVMNGRKSSNRFYYSTQDIACNRTIVRTVINHVHLTSRRIDVMLVIAQMSGASRIM